MILKPPIFSKLIHGHPLGPSGGLAACWPMNEGAYNKDFTKVFDLSGNNNTGTITTASWVTGKFGSALDFSGGGTIATGKTMSNRGLSFVCWARNSTTDDGAVFGENFTKLLFMTNRQAKVTVYLGNGGDYSFLQSGSGLNFAGWHQFAITIPESTADDIILYHDGIQVANGAIEYSTTFTISLVPSDYNPFDEYLDHAILYNRILSPSEIALLCREPFCMFERDPIELWVGSVGAGEPPAGIPIFRRRIEAA